jgi:AcrR family transcriptional regulator
MTSPAASLVNPRTGAATREVLLRAAAREIHVHGFQAASLSRILAETGVTKGALYYHFPSKLALGYAVLDECYAPELRRHWVEPLADAGGDALQTLIGIIRAAGRGMTEADILLGCPVNNLAQEMSPVDEGFRTRIEALFDEWRTATESALQCAQENGGLVPGVDIDASAALIVASLEGCIGMAKNGQSKDILLTCGQGLIAYLQSLQNQGNGCKGNNDV